MIGSMNALSMWPTDEFGLVVKVGDVEVRLEVLPFAGGPGEPVAYLAVYRGTDLVAEKVPVRLDVHGGDDGRIADEHDSAVVA